VIGMKIVDIEKYAKKPIRAAGLKKNKIYVGKGAMCMVCWPDD